MTDQLKPIHCPFCGYFARVQSRNAKSAASGKHFFVRCPSCHTEGPRSTLSEEEAIERWNERQAGCTAAQGESKGNGEFLTARLRRVAKIVDLESAIPDDDDLTECAGSVLGMIASKLERQAGSAEQVSEQSAYFAHQYLRFQEYAKAAGFDSLTSAIAFACQHRYALSAPERIQDETQLAIELARVAHNHVEHGEMRHDVGISLLDVVRKHAAPERKVTDAELPPLPEPEFYVWMDAFCTQRMGRKAPEHLHSIPYFSKRQIHEYALAAINQQGEQTAPDLLSVLREVRHTLQFANDTPNGPINDTIWMMDGPETLFDFIDAALEAAAPSTAQKDVGTQA